MASVYLFFLEGSHTVVDIEGQDRVTAVTIAQVDEKFKPISGTENPDNLIPFDIYEETCTGALVLGGTHELLARKLFKNFQLSCASDSSQPISNWDDLPEQEKNSNRKQAGRIHALLQSFGYLISPLQDWTARDFIFPNEDLQNMAQMEHDLWCLWKRENG